MVVKTDRHFKTMGIVAQDDSGKPNPLEGRKNLKISSDL
jgi:hypothetical protein